MTQESQPTLRSAFTRAVLIQFVPIGLVYFLETAVFKAIQVRALEGHVSIRSVVLGMNAELGFVVPFFVIVAMLYSTRKGVWKRIVRFGYFLVMGYVLVVTAFSHGYFISTGAHLSYGTVHYWLHNMASTNEIIASETKIWKLALVGAQFLFLAAAVLLPRLRFVQKWVDGETEVKNRKIAGWAALLLAVLLLRLMLPDPQGRAITISRSVPLNVFSGLLLEIFGASGTVTIEDDDRQGGVLKFTRPSGAPTPNVVFIIFESLNWKSSDVHTPGLQTTPFLADLAKKSWVIEYPYAVVPHTTKAVLPLLCGFYPYFKQNPLETTPGILPKRCLAHILKDHGYRTAFFQPAYNFEKRDKLAANMGFDVYKGSKDIPSAGFESISYFGFEDNIMIAPSMEWVDTAGDEPFFLTYLTLATHHNYVTPQSFPNIDFGKKDKDHNNFLNAVRYIDEFIKKVFEQFERRGLVDNTIFIIAGDHGEAFAEHGRRQHDLVLWEEGLRTTAMIYAPGLTELEGGSKIDGIRSNLDFVPTVTALVGLELVEGRFVGQSLLEPADDGRKLFHSCWFNNECLAMHDGPVKTIYHYGSQAMEVYDNFKDPNEQFNLVGTGPYDQEYLDEKTKEMRRFKNVVNQQYHEWQKSIGIGGVSTTKPVIPRELDGTFGDHVKILGVGAPDRAVAGQDIKLKYLFKSLRPAPKGDRIFVHVIHGKKYVNADHVPLGGTLPLSKWQPGQFILDEHTVHVPGTWADGELKVYLGIWNKRTKERYPIVTSAGSGGGSRLLVARIPISGSKMTRGLSEEETRAKIGEWVGEDRPNYEKSIGANFDEHVELVGVNLERMNVMLAGTVEMTYVFRSLKKVPPGWKLRVSLIREDGFRIRGDHVPIGGLYPPEGWNPGEYVVDKHRLHIDMYRSKTGTYGVWIGFNSGHKPIPVTWDGPTDSEGRIRIGEVTISKKDARQ